MKISLSQIDEQIVANREKAHYEQFTHLPQFFQKLSDGMHMHQNGSAGGKELTSHGMRVFLHRHLNLQVHRHFIDLQTT